MRRGAAWGLGACALLAVQVAQAQSTDGPGWFPASPPPAAAAAAAPAVPSRSRVSAAADGPDELPPCAERPVISVGAHFEAGAEAPPVAVPCRPHETIRVADRLATMGLRVSSSRGAGTNEIGVSFAGRLADYSEVGFANTHASMFWNLGGGGAGFEGAFGGSLAVGALWPWDRSSGLVGRVGLEGYAVGDNAFYASMFEIPQGQLAYQYLKNDTLLEIGGKVGAVDVGRLRDPSIEKSRVLPFAAELGGYTAIHFAPVRLDASFSRYLTTHDAIGTPIDLVDGALCGFARRVSMCVDARYERGDIPLAAPDTTKLFQSLYGGITVGFGYHPEEHHGRRRGVRAEED